MSTYNVYVEEKDWNRMFDLIADGKDGASVAKSIKTGEKAIARYVAGLRLLNKSPAEFYSSGRFTGYFSDFGNRALTLGVTFQEIMGLWEETVVPKGLSEKIQAYIEDSECRVNIPDNFFKEIRHLGIDLKIEEDERSTTEMAYEYAKTKESKVIIPIRMIFKPYDVAPQIICLDVIADENGQSNRYVFFSQENIDTHLDLINGTFGYTELHDAILAALK